LSFFVQRPTLGLVASVTIGLLDVPTFTDQTFAETVSQRVVDERPIFSR
jgi:hypothetical protein